MSFKLQRFVFGISVLGLLWANGVFAAEENSDAKVSMGGYGFWQFGQIMQGYDRQKGDMDHVWQSGALLGLNITAKPSNQLSLVLSPEFYMNYPYPPDQVNPASVRPFGVAYINEASGIYSFGNVENHPLVTAKLGMFPYKYNPEGTNFGDYLFRTGTYPTYIITNFDFPQSRLLGLCLSTNAIKNLHVDLLVTSEALMFPLYDFSITGIVNYKLFDGIEIGAGLDLARCLPVSENLTSPQWSFDVGGYSNEYIKTNGDTAFYSFKATKAMVRASIDPKPFFGLTNLFGPEDLKLYGEICWVGIEGYKARNDSGVNTWYNNLNARTPRMLGFNFPAFHILDVFSWELEYFPSRIPNDYWSVVRLWSPVPFLPGGNDSYDVNNFNQGDLRWSIYAKKMVVKGFSITGEAAFDHLHTTQVDGSTQTYECLTKKGHWHWNLKFGYCF